MKSTQDLINENNYILREIKEIKGKQNIIQENIEILEDLTEIHEIKDIRKKQINFPKLKKDIEIEIRLEGEAINKKNELIKQEKNNEILGCNCKNNFNSRKTDDKLENNDKNMETLSDNKKTARDLLREAIEKRYKELKEKGSIDESDSDDSF